MQILSWPAAAVPTVVRAQVAALQRQVWPDDGETDAQPGHDPRLQPVCVVLLEGETVVAALDILSKTIAHDGGRYEASGLSAVVTDLARRRRGYGTRLVGSARVAMQRSGADLGVFTCDPVLRPFYEGAGWTPLPDAVLVGGTPRDPLPSDTLGKVVMAAFFTDRARAHAASFAGARIGLYPGAIDKLW